MTRPAPPAPRPERPRPRAGRSLASATRPDRRILVLFGLLVLAPLAAVAYLAAGTARDQRALAAHQVSTLLDERLDDVSSRIDQTLAAIERSLLAALPEAPAAADELRRLAHRDPLVRQVFSIDAGGRVVFPTGGDDASAEERAFLDRTAAIWERRAVLDRVPSAEQAAPPPATDPAGAPASPGRGDSVLDLAADADHGWITWYWEDGLHLLFWRRAGAGVVGAEVERVALLARLVGALPASTSGEGRLALADSRGHPIHQWGPHEPAPGDAPTAVAPLSHPLTAWRLHYFLSPDQRRALAGGARVDLLLGVAAIGVALLGLALYLYREYARRLREASQRVGFVTSVSHELKTPLTNIRMYAELLERDLDGLDEQAADKLGVIVSESQRLSRLIENVLTFSRGREQPAPLRAPIDVGPVADAVLQQFSPALRARGVQWSLHDRATRRALADPDALGQILSNLVSNVEKYAAAGGRLEVTTADRGEHVVVRVVDHGAGIPVAHRDRVFEPFYRVSDRLSDGVTGTGIGLAIARDLARLGGGELALADSARGACFELSVPAQEACS